jgi:TetR/AcrR family transcriptional repressor of nem operon
MVPSDIEDAETAGGVTHGQGRGRWDRGATDDARREDAHARVLAATAEVVASRGAATTAAEVIGRAGIGRNTFYAHFASVDAAVAEVVRGVAEAVSEALHGSAAPVRTPRERLRALASAWLAATSRRPFAMAVLLDASTEGRSLMLGALEAELRAALELARAAGTVSVPIEPLRIACLVGSFVGAASYVARTPDSDLRAAQEALTDLTLRAFR